MVRRRLGEQERLRPGRDYPRGFEWHYLDAQLRPEMRVFTGAGIGAGPLAISPDGRLVASAMMAQAAHRVGEAAKPDGTIRLREIATGREVMVLRGHRMEIPIPGRPEPWAYSTVSGLAFSPDARTLASISLDETLRIWDVGPGREPGVLRTPSVVASLAYSPDGRTIASADYDGSIRLWDVATGRERASVRGTP